MVWRASRGEIFSLHEVLEGDHGGPNHRVVGSEETNPAGGWDGTKVKRLTTVLEAECGNEPGTLGPVAMRSGSAMLPVMC